jgi:hypothetical protein
MAYRAAMPKLLREVGWMVESDEFAEIEDPDPENHEQRQRELINEIEEARKELEKKTAEKEKKGGKLSWWRKKKGDKKEWEVYDENSTLPQQHRKIDADGDPSKIAENPIMFDIDAIRKEVATLAAESKEYNAEAEFEIKEIKSTLPPMKIDIANTTAPPPLRETKSFNDSLGTATLPKQNGSTPKTAGGGYEEYDEFDHGESRLEMTFDTSFRDPPPPHHTSSSSTPQHIAPDPSSSPWDHHTERNQSTWQPTADSAQRPQLTSAKTFSGTGAAGPAYNAWADEFEDDFGQEKEVKMSFM